MWVSWTTSGGGARSCVESGGCQMPTGYLRSRGRYEPGCPGLPNYLTKAAALHDSLILARTICPAQADSSRESNTDRVGAVDGVDVRDLY